MLAANPHFCLSPQEPRLQDIAWGFEREKADVPRTVTAMGTSHIYGVVIDTALRWHGLQVVKESPLALVTEAAINSLQFPASYQHGKVQITQRKHLLPFQPHTRELFAVPGNICQFSLLLWSHLYPVNMLQIYSAGGKLRDGLIEFDQLFSKNCWGWGNDECWWL